MCVRKACKRPIPPPNHRYGSQELRPEELLHAAEQLGQHGSVRDALRSKNVSEPLFHIAKLAIPYSFSCPIAPPIVSERRADATHFYPMVV